MNVQANNLALVFEPEKDCGKLVRMVWPHDVCDHFGHRWVVRFKVEGECIMPDSSLMALDVDPRSDQGARELLDANGQQAWDQWFAPPDVDF